MFQIEVERLSAVFPQLDTLLDATGAEPYCSAPIASQASWDHFVDQVGTKTGNCKHRSLKGRGHAVNVISVFPIPFRMEVILITLMF